ncbi:hypothetical protein BJY00DRAFT_316974 [Aspergillus carlsbadensis]|nr:hypothetical protein BJY00DRAFT_316974 [Aspergillus carlsbadensis]
MERINERASNVLECLSKTVCFENPMVAVEKEAIDTPVHRALIRKPGADGIVLFRNNDKYLGHEGGSAAGNNHPKVAAFGALTEALVVFYLARCEHAPRPATVLGQNELCKLHVWLVAGRALFGVLAYRTR